MTCQSYREVEEIMLDLQSMNLLDTFDGSPKTLIFDGKLVHLQPGVCGNDTGILSFLNSNQMVLCLNLTRA